MKILKIGLVLFSLLLCSCDITWDLSDYYTGHYNYYYPTYRRQLPPFYRNDFRRPYQFQNRPYFYHR